jgi:hypothetical protein
MVFFLNKAPSDNFSDSQFFLILNTKASFLSINPNYPIFQSLLLIYHTYNYGAILKHKAKEGVNYKYGTSVLQAGELYCRYQNLCKHNIENSWYLRPTLCHWHIRES